MLLGSGYGLIVRSAAVSLSTEAFLRLPPIAWVGTM